MSTHERASNLPLKPVAFVTHGHLWAVVIVRWCAGWLAGGKHEKPMYSPRQRGCHECSDAGSSRAERTCRQWFERCLGNRPAIAGSMMGTCEARYEKAKQSGYWVRGKTGVPCRR